jgi:hypothetical protein
MSQNGKDPPEENNSRRFPYNIHPKLYSLRPQKNVRAGFSRELEHFALGRCHTSYLSSLTSKPPMS